MSALDFAARAKALEARLIAEGVSGTAEAARTAATQAEGKADAAQAAADLVSAMLEISRKDIENASAEAKMAGEAAEAASKAAQVAEQLAQEAAASAPRLFASLAAAGLPASVSRIDSTGHNADGHGAATYISDELATAALTATHPLACFKGDGNRFFRLVPDTQGFITAEQMGCPPYEAGVNVQPYIQAAIDYAHAMKAHGIKGVAFGQEKYELWTPSRTQGINNPPGGPGDYSGIPILIRRKIALKAAPGGTQLVRKKWNGRNPAEWNVDAKGETAQPTDFVHSQSTVAPAVFYWRGGMFTLVHTERVSGKTPHEVMDYTDLAGINFQGRWRLDGGIPRSDFAGQYYQQGDPYAVGKLEPATGFGWDWSDKPIWFSNLGWTGDVTFDHLEISGFRGELIYQGGELHGSIRGRRLLLEGSDGNGLNPGPVWCEDGKPGRLEIDHLTIRNCFQAFEGGSGRGTAHMGLIEVVDCYNGGVVHPGDYNQDPMNMPVKPVLTIDRVVLSGTGLVEQGRTPNSYGVAFFTHIGEIIATDNVVSLGSAQGNCFDSTVGRITMIAHKAGYTVDLKSITDRDNNYSLHRSQDCLVGEIVHQQTPYARANNISASAGFSWSKSDYGPNIRIGRLTGSFGTSSQSVSGTATLPAYLPVLENLSCIGRAGGFPWNIETTPKIGEIIAHFMRLSTSSSVAGTVFPVTLPAPYGKYDRGFRFKMAHYANDCVVSVTTTNTNMAKRMLMLRAQEYEFVSDGSTWAQVTPGSVLSAVSPAIALAAGGESAPITVNGARAGMEVRVVPQGDIGGAQVMGRVTANNTVVLRNVSAVAASSVAYRVLVDWAS